MSVVVFSANLPPKNAKNAIFTVIYDLLRHLIETNYLSYDLQFINVSVLGPNTYFLVLHELLSTFLRG